MDAETHSRDRWRPVRSEATEPKDNAPLGDMLRALVEEAARQWLPRRATSHEQPGPPERPAWSPYQTTSYEVPRLEPLRNPADITRRTELPPLDSDRHRDPGATAGERRQRREPGRSRHLPPL
ncbi:hypothetical protein GII33_14845 [Gordonia pseudamarae]|jgi:hypothetical protein|uniref:Transposase n=1 Tax=Gordonia pseudamarae TaxID=2831662 RepID=A0ABX6IJN8_9ACTN|nr:MULTISPECIES: hypothetical protein [Gordonia]MBD0024164.1 hypothetical protein [Gordonia sp. (in: high G+C Gram-positive bacteria)]QHN27038.1 hypothetical protein GII33_14845 [Gordonia pseudamarae]QHN35927.1 hypothetical protein GII31_14670 [Gordonia pseudamarae]